MPNHVTNKLKFKGKQEDILALRNAIRPDVKADQSDDGGGALIDFEKIIPMPKDLRIESSSAVDNGMAVLMFKETGASEELASMLSWPWVKAEGISSVKELAEYLLKEKRADLILGQKALDNIKNYGHKDWYSWSTVKWGTKWNAYSQIEIDENEICFDTAWSSPYPVIKKLSRMFPKVEILLQYADEDFGQNCGEVTLKAGKEIKENIPEGGSIEAYVLASEVQGRDIENMIEDYHDTEDEEFATTIVEAVLQKVEPELVVEIAVDCENYCGTTTMLEVIKGELLSRELYELVNKIDEKIKEVSMESEEN
jgi:hypothetical protein